MDNRVFHANYEEKKPLFTVDLLLDASASRLQYQEMIAAQGVILSESLQACHIPVRVSEFCSVRGYTALRILKEFEEKITPKTRAVIVNTPHNPTGVVYSEETILRDSSVRIPL